MKWFNNLYTEVKGRNDQGDKTVFPRQNFFTSSRHFTGISDSNRVNIGLLLEYRSNTIQGRNILTPIDFKRDPFKRSGLSSISPAIKFNPIKNWGRFTVQTSFSIPLFEDEVAHNIFRSKGYTFQKSLFL